MKLENTLGSLHRFLGKSPLLHSLFLKLRNQILAVISHGLNDGIEMSNNGEAWLIAQIAPNAHFFIDVGANKGAWTAEFLSKTVTRVQGIMYEPSSGASNFIKIHRKHHERFDQVEVIESAISDRIGQTTFYEEPACGESSSIVPGFSRADAEPKQVAVTTLDAEIERRGISFVDILKIDAEGYDLHVLKGVTNSLKRGIIDVIQFEYNAPWALANSTLHEALEIFRRNQYRVYLLRSNGLQHFDYQKYGEFYRYANFVALSQHGEAKYSNILPGSEMS